MVGAHKLPQLPPIVDLAGVIDVVIQNEDEHGQLEKDEANPPGVSENHEREDPSRTEARCCSIVEPIKPPAINIFMQRLARLVQKDDAIFLSTERVLKVPQPVLLRRDGLPHCLLGPLLDANLAIDGQGCNARQVPWVGVQAGRPPEHETQNSRKHDDDSGHNTNQDVGRGCADTQGWSAAWVGGVEVARSVELETNGLGGQWDDEGRASNHQCRDEGDRVALKHRDSRGDEGHDAAVLHREGLCTRGSALSCEGLERLVQLGVDIDDPNEDHQQDSNELRQERADEEILWAPPIRLGRGDDTGSWSRPIVRLLGRGKSRSKCSCQP